MSVEKICERCILNSSVPKIEFDQNGICNYCKSYEKKAQFIFLPAQVRREKLKNIIGKIKEEGKNKKYDCIIGIGGGVDSSYTAFLTKEYGLRPLAIHVDNGWNTELAVKNVENIVKTLKIDLYTHVLDWEVFRDLQLAFLKSSITNLEIPTDHTCTAILYNKAAKEGIKYIITGNNLATEGIQPPDWGEYNKDEKLLKSIHKQFGTVKFKNIPTISMMKFAYYIFIKQIKQISILDYVDYDKNKVKQILKDRLCWKDYGAKHYESLFTRFYQGYILVKKYNVDKRLGHLSTLIMSGQITREEALEGMKLPLYPENLLQEDKELFLKKLRISETEFEDIMKLPVKSYKDYPSNIWIFKKFSFLIRAVKKFSKF